MGGRGATASFIGPQTLATVEDLDAFVRRASAGEAFTYCEAPELMRSPTSARVIELERDGLVRPHRNRRGGGGWTFFVVRTSRAIGREVSPLEAALADPATDLIFRELKRAANFGLACPPDTELARKAGLATRNQAQWRVRKLIEVGLIGSTVVYDGGVPSRVVTIAETGKSTALPAKWAALNAAAAKDAAGMAR